MTYTLWRAATLLGEGELDPAPGPGGGLAGPFRPTAAFADVWPVFGAFQVASARTVLTFGALPRGADADAIRAHLRARDPDNTSGAAFNAIEALGLEVRDNAGRAVPDVRALVASWMIPIPDDLTAEQRLAAERDIAAIGVVVGGPNYLLTLIPRRPGTPGPPGSAPSTGTAADGSADEQPG